MRQIRSDSLKIIAIVCMAIDHIGAYIITEWMNAITDPSLYEYAETLYEITRAVGRIAFPIFCYQIVVGLMRTKSRERYLINLLIFGIISEIPFDLSLDHVLFSWSYQNVFFTLFLGALVIYLYEKLELRIFGSGIERYEGTGKVIEYLKEDRMDFILRVILFTAISVAACVTAEMIHCDYGAKGVLLIIIFYAFRNSGYKMLIWGILLFLLEIAIITYLRTYSWHVVYAYTVSEAYACLAFPLVYRDNGERTKSRLFKWFGYCFYPGHLLVIYLICRLCFGV